MEDKVNAALRRYREIQRVVDQLVLDSFASGAPLVKQRRDRINRALELVDDAKQTYYASLRDAGRPVPDVLVD
jgi:hypothetical protein